MVVDPKDIDYFTLSHSHLDHSGNANLFKSATWIVDEAERDFMFREEARQCKEYKNYNALEHAQVRPFTSDHDVFGDGSVVIRSEEHTTELQSLMRISYADC